MKNNIKGFDQFVNENILRRAGKRVSDWAEGVGKKVQHSINLKIWRAWEDAIVDHTLDQFNIPSTMHGSEPTIVSEEPLTFEYTLRTYDENDSRATKRTFRYTLPKDPKADVTKGTLEEVTQGHHPW